MPSKDSLVIYARSVATSYGTMSNESKWELLKDIYDKALEVPPDWTKKGPTGTNWDAIKAGRWLRKNGVPGGTNVPLEGIAWCGIFATYCLQAIGVPVKWRVNKGITPLANDKENPSNYLKLHPGYFEADTIGPGDICVKGTNQHHFIVHRRVGNMLHSYDGNLAGQNIGEAKPSDVDELKSKIKAQAEAERKMTPEQLQAANNSSKFSFYFYRLL